MKHKLTVIGILVLLFGLSLTITSFFYDRYSDKSAFNEKYGKITYSDENKNEKFYDLKEEYLTLKDNYFDYGITFGICGLTILLLSIIGIRKIKSPSKRWIILSIGLLATVTTTIAYTQDLFMEYSRGSFPHWEYHWGDTLIGVIIFIMLLFWAGLNSIGLIKPFNTPALIFPIKIAENNGMIPLMWYLIIAGLSLLITIWNAANGYFWYVIPGLLWVYFYISILSGWRSAIPQRSSQIITTK